MPRILAASITLLAVMAFWPEPAAAQFWSPWSSRGYHPPQRGEGVFNLPWQRPRPAKPKRPPPPKQPARHEPAPPAEPVERPVPYAPEFARLAELLGALHYLAPLCGKKQPDRWRAEMQGLLDAEQPTQKRKDHLIASFNRGYQSYELTYHHCTPSANLAIGRSRAEGAKLARDIATRYGN